MNGTDLGTSLRRVLLGYQRFRRWHEERKHPDWGGRLTAPFRTVTPSPATNRALSKEFQALLLAQDTLHGSAALSWCAGPAHSCWIGVATEDSLTYAIAGGNNVAAIAIGSKTGGSRWPPLSIA